jgi:p-hydroxybenzoate 3-monooxygenase
LRTQVAIIGGGPAGMFLALLLSEAGVAAVVLEQRSRAYVEGRVRAGVLEAGTVALMERLGLAERLRREGLVHTGVNFASENGAFRIDLAALTGRTIAVYGQQAVMRDLFDAAEARGVDVVFEAAEVMPHGIDGDAPQVTWRKDGAEHRLGCDFVVGCDGSHGVSRTVVPPAAITLYGRDYPFGWLGVLADAPPAAPELIYCNHARGFALASMRSATRSRYYVQRPLDEPPDAWSDDRFWDELILRMGPAGGGVTRGAAIEKTFAPLRSFVAEPMRFGRLFLAGDAAHIVPPTGAKGLNLAVSDVLLLAEALAEHHAEGSGLDAYSGRALARVWKAERFSWWLTRLTHSFPGDGPIERKLQLAELDYLAASPAAQTAFAENYVGLPLEPRSHGDRERPDRGASGRMRG